MIDINPSHPEQQTGERPLNLSDFAQRNQITEDRVWELIEEGELAARFVNDEILILREQEAAGEPQIELPEAPAIFKAAEPEPLPIPPAPETETIVEADPGETAGDLEAARDEIQNLPTEDHRDLLMFAQDAMNRTMDLSRQLLATKDELIRMKDEKILQLQSEMQKNEQEIRRLRKKIEDLETLCRLTPSV